ncbi:hypothetical protein [Kitasatospora sp. NPDC057015]|uniref:hypothetical protein n=1 Tax=Kitasatospora sp. NPDC057015 TaxID=3346001 RepID=UPI00363608ED
MSTGTGSSGGSGSGYRVEVDNLKAFAAQVRRLLAEFEAYADGTKTHGQSAIGRNAFGTFAEAKDLHAQYELMRDGLRDVMNQLQDAVNDAHRKAELTAVNYEEQEHSTSQKLKLSSDGWSVANPSATSTAAVIPTIAPPAGAAQPRHAANGRSNQPAQSGW